MWGGFFALVVTGYLVFTFQLGREPEEAFKNMAQTLTLVSYGGYHPGSWLETFYLIASFLFMLCLAALIVDAFFLWRKREKDGTGSYRWRRGHLIVNAIDWEKVQSIVEELRRRGQKTDLVVISETLEELPRDLFRLGVRFVKGSLRRRETYLRAGLKRAKVAFICSGDYNDPNIGDASTSACTNLIERHRSDVVTAAEVVVKGNNDLFSLADHVVPFDPTYLKVVARKISERLKGRPAKISVVSRVVAEGEPEGAYDEAQNAELMRQLKAAGVVLNDDGVLVRILLPSDLNEPLEADVITHARMLRATEEIVVPVYLSIESRDLFDECDKAVCVDEVMAQSLVQAILPV